MVHVGTMRNIGHKLKREVQAGYNKKLLQHEDSQAVFRKVLLFPSLEVFKTQLDNTLSNLVWYHS